MYIIFPTNIHMKGYIHTLTYFLPEFNTHNRADVYDKGDGVQYNIKMISLALP